MSFAGYPHVLGELQPGGHCSRSGGGALEQTVLHAQPATAPTLTVTDGWEFSGWSVDFDRVTSDLTVLAQYEPDASTDTDGDGLTDYDEVYTTLIAADSDGDGTSDGEEVAQGSDPLDAESPAASIGWTAGLGLLPLALWLFLQSGRWYYFNVSDTRGWELLTGQWRTMEGLSGGTITNGRMRIAGIKTPGSGTMRTRSGCWTLRRRLGRDWV